MVGITFHPYVFKDGNENPEPQFLPACDNLSVISPHNLIANDIIRKCVLIGVYVFLLEEICHPKGGF